jgi:hypothetical protein
MKIAAVSNSRAEKKYAVISRKTRCKKKQCLSDPSGVLLALIN